MMIQRMYLNIMGLRLFKRLFWGWYMHTPKQTNQTRFVQLASQKLSVNTTKCPYKQAYYLSKQISTKCSCTKTDQKRLNLYKTQMKLESDQRLYMAPSVISWFHQPLFYTLVNITLDSQRLDTKIIFLLQDFTVPKIQKDS